MTNALVATDRVLSGVTSVERAPDVFPSTSATTSALGGERMREMAFEMALEMERRRQQVVRGGAIAVGVGIAAVTVSVCAAIGGVGAYLFPVLLIGASLGISVALATLALSTAAVEAVVRLHWHRVARQYGLDAGMASQALEDARTRLYNEDRARLESLQARQFRRDGKRLHAALLDDDDDNDNDDNDDDGIIDTDDNETPQSTTQRHQGFVPPGEAHQDPGVDDDR